MRLGVPPDTYRVPEVLFGLYQSVRSILSNGQRWCCHASMSWKLLPILANPHPLFTPRFAIMDLARRGALNPCQNILCRNKLCRARNPSALVCFCVACVRDSEKVHDACLININSMNYVWNQGKHTVGRTFLLPPHGFSGVSSSTHLLCCRYSCSYYADINYALTQSFG